MQGRATGRLTLLLATASAGVAFLFITAAVSQQTDVTEFAPLDYFDKRCASCHGPYGSFYGDSFGAGLSDAGLREVIHEMAEGPAGAPLKASELEAMTAYHRSLISKQPFVVVTAIRDNILTGEVSPGSRILLIDQGKRVPVYIEGHTWEAELPGGRRSFERAVLYVTGKGKAVTLRLGEHRYSHIQSLD